MSHAANPEFPAGTPGAEQDLSTPANQAGVFLTLREAARRRPWVTPAVVGVAGVAAATLVGIGAALGNKDAGAAQNDDPFAPAGSEPGCESHIELTDLPKNERGSAEIDIKMNNTPLPESQERLAVLALNFGMDQSGNDVSEYRVFPFTEEDSIRVKEFAGDLAILNQFNPDDPILEVSVLDAPPGEIFTHQSYVGEDPRDNPAATAYDCGAWHAGTLAPIEEHQPGTAIPPSAQGGGNVNEAPAPGDASEYGEGFDEGVPGSPEYPEPIGSCWEVEQPTPGTFIMPGHSGVGEPGWRAYYWAVVDNAAGTEGVYYFVPPDEAGRGVITLPGNVQSWANEVKIGSMWLGPDDPTPPGVVDALDLEVIPFTNGAFQDARVCDHFAKENGKFQSTIDD